MKKNISLLIILILLTSLITGCDAFTNSNKVDIEQSVYDEYESMIDAFIGVQDISVISDYLIQWAQNYQIDAEKDHYNNVIITIPATEGQENVVPTLIECGISISDLENDLRPVAIMMTTIRNLEAHGLTYFVFTPYEGRLYTGAENLSSSLLSDVNLINLNTYAPNQIVSSGAESAVYTMSLNMKMADPSFPIAYELRIDGLTGGYSDIIKQKNPNAIKTLGNFLASCKSSGMLFELASFNGGQNVDMYPVSASAIMLINQNDENSLNNRFLKAQKTFNDNYSETQPQYSYTLTPVPLPEKVISQEDSDHIVSFLYTLFNGIYSKTEADETEAVSNIGQVRTDDKQFVSYLTMRSLDPAVFLAMQSDLSVISNLNELTYQMILGKQGWRQLPGKSLASRFSEATSANVTDTFYESQCSIYQNRNKDIEIISYGVDLIDCEKQCKNLLKFITVPESSEQGQQP